MEVFGSLEAIIISLELELKFKIYDFGYWMMSFGIKIIQCQISEEQDSQMHMKL